MAGQSDHGAGGVKPGRGLATRRFPLAPVLLYGPRPMEQARESTAGRTGWVRLFFSSGGRMGRPWFAFAVAVLLMLFAGYEAAVRGVLHGLTAWLVHLVLLSSAGCVLSKRLHDRGRAGWWAAPVLFAFAVVWPRPEGLVDAAFALVLAWAAIELILLPASAGARRFGPPSDRG